MSRDSRVERAKQRAGVVVAYPHTDKVDSAFHNCIISLLIRDAQGPRRIVDHGDHFGLRSGPRIAAARNQICSAFLAHPLDPSWLLMIDTDMVFGTDLLDSLLDVADPDESPVVGGLCFTGGASGRIEPTLTVMHKDGDTLEFERVWNYPDGLVSVDATGAACLLVHRKVLEALNEKFGDTQYPFFAESQASELPMELGEDVTFCLRVRGLGFPVKVDTRIKVGHMKPQVIDEETYIAFRRAITDEPEHEYLARNMARVYGKSGTAQRPGEK